MEPASSHDPGRHFLGIEGYVATLLSEVGEIPSSRVHPKGEGTIIRFDQDGGDDVAPVERAAQHRRGSVDAGLVISTNLNRLRIHSGHHQRRKRRQRPPSRERVVQRRGEIRRGVRL